MTKSLTTADLYTSSPWTLSGERVRLAEDIPLGLASGEELHGIDIAFQTWGELNADKSNAVLICHALTGDHYVIGPHPMTGKAGWWEAIVGPGKVIDTDRYFVICSNILGGCAGSTGPLSVNPETNQPWGLDFPFITIGDMVAAQKRLVDHLGIDKLFAVVGGSMGGMQVLEWASQFPDHVFAAVPIATAPRHSAQNIAFHEVGRQAIVADPDWCGGRYSEKGKYPHRGLAVARMAAHITYLSEAALTRKFGRNLQDRENVTYGFDADFQVESYLRHQGSTFVDRFDANAYLFITRAMDYFDVGKRSDQDGDEQLVNAFKDTPVRFLVVSFSSDWLYPTRESREIVHALNAGAANVSFVEVQSDKGHDAFLLNEPDFHQVFEGFLDGCAEHRGLNRKPA